MGGGGFSVTYRNRKNANEHASESETGVHNRATLPGLRLGLMMCFLSRKVVSKVNYREGGRERERERERESAGARARERARAIERARERERQRERRHQGNLVDLHHADYFLYLGLLHISLPCEKAFVGGKDHLLPKVGK
jgi:hypothetical protein